MRHFMLQRQPAESNHTFGHMYDIDRGVTVCVTMEPGEDEEDFPSIEAGTYVCSPHSGTKFKRTWILEGENVYITPAPSTTGSKMRNKLAAPGRPRFYIVIHAGNYASDTKGCIMVGRGISEVNSIGQPMITHSGSTQDRLREDIGEDTTFILIIKDAPKKRNALRNMVDSMRAWFAERSPEV